MSDIMFNDGNYKNGDWQKYCIHTDTEIKGFFGPYRFLSNFESCNIYGFPSVENAYMAAKIIPSERAFFKTCSPRDAKEKWREFTSLDKSPEEWDGRKFNVMARCAFEKFLVNEELRANLLATGDKHLEELNWWKDTYWGVDVKLGGKNNLGKILMATRTYFKNL